MKSRFLFTLITFAILLTSCAPKTRFTLYYYNPELDKDAGGNIRCSSTGLVAVKRAMNGAPTGTGLIGWTVRFLLMGELTDEERDQGVTTQFPLEGVELLNTDLHDGTLTLTFADPNHRTSGGACRADILWAQIEATAKQFPGVERVQFSPEDLFQP